MDADGLPGKFLACYKQAKRAPHAHFSSFYLSWSHRRHAYRLRWWWWWWLRQLLRQCFNLQCRHQRFEHYDNHTVGEHYKNPRAPVWLTLISPAHFEGSVDREGGNLLIFTLTCIKKF